MKNKIFLFFDFDGVLVTFRELTLKLDTKDSLSTLRDNMHLKMIDYALKQVDLEAYFIPISSWSSVFHNKEVLKDFLNKETTNLKVFEPCHYLNTNGQHPEAKKDDCCMSRALIVRDFIKEYNVQNYLIFDDEGEIEYRHLGLKHIKTSTEDGITGQNYNEFYFYVDKFWKDLK